MKAPTIIFLIIFQLNLGIANAGVNDVRQALNQGKIQEGKLLLLELVKDKDVKALRLYAEFLIKGEYFSRNVNTAIIVLDQAARLGDEVSRETLVKMYSRGRFVKKSESRADYYAQLNQAEGTTKPEVINTEPEINRTPKSDSAESQPTEKGGSSGANSVTPKILMPFGKKEPPSWSSDSAPAVRAKASGSGFAATKNGYVVTNQHVVQGCNQVYLIYQDRLKRAKILLEDAKADVAILKVDGDTPAYIKGSRASLTLGLEVLAAGFPLQEMLGSAIKITDGIISSDAVNDGMFQHSAPTQPGNSGGPLINRTGEVVGIVTAVLKPVDGYTPQNVNFAVPASVIRERLNRVNVSWEMSNNRVDFDTVSLAAGLKKAAANILCF